jgi:hypothetical protein
MKKASISINDIKIPNRYINNAPKDTKVNRECNKYKANGNKLVKPIVLNEKNVLQDGYAGYLALKQLGITQIIVEYR